MPLRMPEFSKDQIEALSQRSFSTNVAEILNLLFGTKLDGWAVEFAIGRYPVRLVDLNSKVTVAETWHNPDWTFQRLVKNLAKSLTGAEEEITDWMLIAARIAVLFGIFGELLQNGMTDRVDLVVPGGDFSLPMAAWYARSWGLPIGTIVICTNENHAIWNLLHQGELRMDAVAQRTDLPDCDQAVPRDLERLIYSTLGPDQLAEFLRCRRSGCNFYLTEYWLDRLRQGLYPEVVSSDRVNSVINHLYKDNGYLADPYVALCHGGLVDYRSRSGAGGNALILSEESPAFYLDRISTCLGIPRRELKERMNKT